MVSGTVPPVPLPVTWAEELLPEELRVAAEEAGVVPEEAWVALEAWLPPEE